MFRLWKKVWTRGYSIKGLKRQKSLFAHNFFSIGRIGLKFCVGGSFYICDRPCKFQKDRNKLRWIAYDSLILPSRLSGPIYGYHLLLQTILGCQALSVAITSGLRLSYTVVGSV